MARSTRFEKPICFMHCTTCSSLYVTVLVVAEKDTFFLEGAAAASAFSSLSFDDSNATNAEDVAFINSE